MKNLIINYINKLDIDKIINFGIKNDIYLNNNEANFILNLAKNNFNDIIINEKKYLNLLKENISYENYIKIEKLFLYYKNRYQGYLF